MFAPFIQIAADKATTPAQRDMLGDILSLARRLDQVEAAFKDKINNSKAARGEAPTRLSRSERGEMNQFDADARAMEEEQLAELRGLPGAAEVIFVIHAGMEPDIKFWQNSIRYAHPAESAIVRELVDAKLALYESLSRFLVSGREI